MLRFFALLTPGAGVGLLVIVGGFALMQPANANPAFARKYNLTCAACHAAFPRLNVFGEQFVANNMKLPNWREAGTRPIGDKMLALPESVPLAVRAQAYVQERSAKSIDIETGETAADANTDIQAPYMIKLLSGAPLSEHLTYYFYGIFAEKGSNGEAVVEDAWFRYDDLFGSGAGMQLGQFQISDLMFPREQRLTFQDFVAYRMAGITYDRGLLFDRAAGPMKFALGVVNGNGVNANFNINNPGFARPDKIFDNDNRKSVFGRIGVGGASASIGVFALSGQQKGAADLSSPAGQERSLRDTDKRAAGLDLSGNVDGRWYWFAQGLWNSWQGFLDSAPKKDFRWFGGFAGVDYVASDRWVFSTLYNYDDAGDLRHTDTIYEGIDMNSLALGVSYYFMRNAKGVIEANYDFLDKKQKSGNYFTGHLEKENYLLVGFDAAF